MVRAIDTTKFPEDDPSLVEVPLSRAILPQEGEYFLEKDATNGFLKDGLDVRCTEVGVISAPQVSPANNYDIFPLKDPSQLPPTLRSNITFWVEQMVQSEKLPLVTLPPIEDALSGTARHYRDETFFDSVVIAPGNGYSTDNNQETDQTRRKSSARSLLEDVITSPANQMGATPSSSINRVDYALLSVDQRPVLVVAQEVRRFSDLIEATLSPREDGHVPARLVVAMIGFLGLDAVPANGQIVAALIDRMQSEIFRENGSPFPIRIQARFPGIVSTYFSGRNFRTQNIYYQEDRRSGQIYGPYPYRRPDSMHSEIFTSIVI